MPNLEWTILNHLQLGQYAEYFAKMEFASYGLDVYTSEVDDHGIDFVVKDNDQRFCEIQVKSLRKSGYVFMRKTHFDINDNNLYLVLVLFFNGKLPDIFLIPAKVWIKPKGIFVDRNYDKPGQKSAPEYGINISKKNYGILEKYTFDKAICSFL